MPDKTQMVIGIVHELDGLNATARSWLHGLPRSRPSFPNSLVGRMPIQATVR